MSNISKHHEQVFHEQRPYSLLQPAVLVQGFERKEQPEPSDAQPGGVQGSDLPACRLVYT